MSTGTDRGTSSFAHAWWGLRRYWWLLVVSILVLAGLGGYAQTTQTPTYQAEALIVAQQLALDNEALPGYAESVFASGAVARVVAGQPGLDVDPETVIPERLQVNTAPDSVAIEVVAEHPDPEAAAELANAAATAFVTELNRAGAGVGVFALQDRASIPTSPLTGALTLPIAVLGGAVAGAVLGSVLIALMLLLRRPVIDARDAERAVGLPVYGLVELPRLRSSEFPSPRGVPGIAAVTRHVLAAEPDAVLVTGSTEVSPARRRISVMLAVSLQPFRTVQPRMARPLGDAVRAHLTQVRPGNAGRGEPAAHGGPLVLVDGAEPLDIMEYQDRSRLTLLVVRQGMTTQRLRLLVAEYLEGELDALVLYRVNRGRRGTAAGISPEERAPEEPALEEPGRAERIPMERPSPGLAEAPQR